VKIGPNQISLDQKRDRSLENAGGAASNCIGLSPVSLPNWSMNSVRARTGGSYTPQSFKVTPEEFRSL